MHVRITSATGVTEFDRALEMVRNRVVPRMEKQHGYVGIGVSGERSTGNFMVLSLWETEADMYASESTADKAREETLDALGASASVERFEQAYQLTGSVPPGPGSKVQVRRLRIDVARLGEHLEYFESTVTPAMSSMPGFQEIRHLVNRDTGEGVVGVVWADEAALQAATRAGEERRRHAGERGVQFGDATVQEILYAAMH